jgi:hypothetical protein
MRRRASARPRPKPRRRTHGQRGDRRRRLQAINYFVANKYVEALGKFANSPNQKLLILPTETTSVLGSLAGIAEIAKEAFGEENRARPRGAAGRVPSAGARPDESGT